METTRLIRQLSPLAERKMTEQVSRLEADKTSGPYCPLCQKASKELAEYTKRGEAWDLPEHMQRHLALVPDDVLLSETQRRRNAKRVTRAGWPKGKPRAPKADIQKWEVEYTAAGALIKQVNPDIGA